MKRSASMVSISSADYKTNYMRANYKFNYYERRFVTNP
jgi:hypothetical protein